MRSLWFAAHYHEDMSEQGAAGGPYRVLLQPSGRSFRAPAERPLLAAAAEAGLELE